MRLSDIDHSPGRKRTDVYGVHLGYVAFLVLIALSDETTAEVGWNSDVQFFGQAQVEVVHDGDKLLL